MRVLLDTRPSQSPTGIGRYSRSLGSLASRIPRHRCWTLGAPGSAADVHFDAVSRIEEELHLPALLERESIDVHHSPLFQLPACLPWRGIVTIHDAIPAVRPDLTTPAFARLYEEAHEADQRANPIV